MSPIKKHRNMSNHQEMKHRRRKPNIPELVYKFLIANEAFDGNEHCLVNKCRCDQGKHHKVTDPISTIGESIGCRIRQRWRKDIGRISKLHNINQCPISKNRPILYLQKCMDRKHGTKEAEKYMKKALNFGVESGYLIPSDPTYRIVHVSSDLMKSDSRRNKVSICDMIISKNHDIPTKFQSEDFQKQKRTQRRQERYRRDQRLRSASRTRHKSKRKKRRRSCSGRCNRYDSR
ncbi:PREDICTED: uncharacterized protein LOC108759703 [Trachymyrmex cornetzi]|uniref:uncharacterized protein LOC108759703 n=1 Tax=Trachymyrmex cornetzi TaxID=471704 RepID=UPI00084F19CB|nr:PREDICTED: uncharacterized protein LOC108759703 [Trachymyrmex cornetzi]